LVSHLAENSSKVSSACSLRNLAEVLKLEEAMDGRPEPAIKPGTTTEHRAIIGWLVVRMGFARKNDVEPRATTRISDEDDMAKI
jgi:hypothetical protein